MVAEAMMELMEVGFIMILLYIASSAERVIADSVKRESMYRAAGDEI
jgi:hypothetical protein